MNSFHNKSLTPNAQKLRREMTSQERKLWYEYLKNLPVRFGRQRIVREYILDFYCAQGKLAIELDGSQHYEQDGMQKDRIRDEFLKSFGIEVIRYSNTDVDHHFSGVCSDIEKHLREKGAWKETE